MEESMSRSKKTSPAFTLPPLEPFQQQMIDLMPLADALAERIITTMPIDADPFTVQDATEFLYHHMLKTSHKSERDETEDQRRGSEMSAAEDASLMIGFALGRRIGGRP
jgi:hypothetical protein